MLTITLPEKEVFDEKKEEFFYLKPVELKLEHSLLSISKWESKWNKPWMTSMKEMTAEEFLDYLRCMTINNPVPEDAYYRLTSEHINIITDYIMAPMTATTINSHKKTTGRKEVVTSELMYAWMAAFRIPFTCEKWHLNRLLTLIKVCSIINGSEQDKMSPKEAAAHQAALNAARRKAMKGKK